MDLLSIDLQNGKQNLKKIKFLLKNKEYYPLVNKIMRMEYCFFKEVFQNILQEREINSLELLLFLENFLENTTKVYIDSKILNFENDVMYIISLEPIGKECSINDILKFIDNKEKEKVSLINMIYKVLLDQKDKDIDVKMLKYEKIYKKFNKDNLLNIDYYKKKESL